MAVRHGILRRRDSRWPGESSHCHWQWRGPFFPSLFKKTTNSLDLAFCIVKQRRYVHKCHTKWKLEDKKQVSHSLQSTPDATTAIQQLPLTKCAGVEKPAAKGEGYDKHAIVPHSLKGAAEALRLEL